TSAARHRACRRWRVIPISPCRWGRWQACRWDCRSSVPRGPKRSCYHSAMRTDRRLTCANRLFFSRFASGSRGVLVPVFLAFVLTRDRVEHLRVACLLEIFQRLTAHGCVDVQVGRADDGAELFQEEENHAVLNERTPIASANHVALFGGEPSR